MDFDHFIYVKNCDAEESVGQYVWNAQNGWFRPFDLADMIIIIIFLQSKSRIIG